MAILAEAVIFKVLRIVNMTHSAEGNVKRQASFRGKVAVVPENQSLDFAVSLRDAKPMIL